MRFLLLLITVLPICLLAQDRSRDLGIEIGVLPTGRLNAITDVTGVKVGHHTLIMGDGIRTGATAIIPHGGDIYQLKVPAAAYIGNGYGKLMGYSQIEELGNIETPIVLTNTMSVPTAADALITYTIAQNGNENVRSVNAVVGETNDGYLNDIRGRHIQESHVLSAIADASSGAVAEGSVGAGTGTICFGYKGGIGTSSRQLLESMGGYTVGVLVQSNFGGVLTIDGAPVGEELGRYPYRQQIEESSDGSCMIIVITDAPVSDRNLKRMAKRAMLGLARTGGIASNGSGDYVIALSNYPENLIPSQSDQTTRQTTHLRNAEMTPLFLATIEATEEAIINSLFAGETMTGHRGTVEALPREKVMEILRQYGRARE